MSSLITPGPAKPTRSQARVLREAKARGWRVIWMHRLLVLETRFNGTTYLVQVLFDGRERWSYALTFYRQGTYESPTNIVWLRRDLFAHLADPAAL